MTKKNMFLFIFFCFSLGKSPFLPTFAPINKFYTFNFFKNMKKFFYSMAVAAMVAGAPMTMVSCDGDTLVDVINTIFKIVNTQDLAYTSWATSDNSFTISFTDYENGTLYEKSVGMEQGTSLSFTYTIEKVSNSDGEYSVIKVTLSGGTVRNYTVEAYDKENKQMTLVYGNRQYSLVKQN